ncbi:hypothetical protein TrCOL_g3328 [Triparma columacea]|uniref:Uncharacterized protein n=1 Tax=Triparma columacea TaxID=722753 RepID=A0A9W7LCV1_9STRA|nr:hypothetical protein TrCOL_g3328 [Triparma columacea]
MGYTVQRKQDALDRNLKFVPISTTLSPSSGTSQFVSNLYIGTITLSPQPPPGALVSVQGSLDGDNDHLLLAGITLDDGGEVGEYRLNVAIQTKSNREVTSFITVKLSATLVVSFAERSNRKQETRDILNLLSKGGGAASKVTQESEPVDIQLLVGPSVSFSVSSVGPPSSRIVHVIARCNIESLMIDRIDLGDGVGHLGKREFPVELQEAEEYCFPFVMAFGGGQEGDHVTFTTTAMVGNGVSSTTAVLLQPKGMAESGDLRGRHTPAAVNFTLRQPESRPSANNTVVNLSILNPSNKSMVVGSVFAIEVEVELKSSATSNKINDLILFLVDEGTEELLPLDSSVSVGKLEVGEKRTVHVRFQGLRVGVVKIPEIQAFSKIEKVSYCSNDEDGAGGGLEVLIIERE